MSLYGWSPDGKQILAEYTTSEAHRQIVMVTVEAGALHVVKDLSQRAQSLTLSPDGRFIAYDSAPDDKTIAKDVFVLAVDGSHESPIVDGKSDDYAPVWSPDGSRLLFMSDRTGTHSLWAVPVEQGKASGPFELLKPDLGRIHPLGMTRDGVLLYLPSSSNRTNVYSADLGRDGKVVQAPLRVTDRFLNTNMGTTLSPDGRYLGYFSNRPGAPVLVVRTLATGDERAVTWPLANGPFFGAGPDFFPDNGAVLAFAREGQSGFGLYRVDLANGNPELLVRIKQGGFQGYSLSPDGRSIYYSCQDDASPNLSNHLVRYDLDTRQETELARGEWFITVRVSPDGKQLTYLVSIRPGSDSVIKVMPTSGGTAREIYRGSHWTDGSRYSTLAWSKDGLYVAFARGGSGGRNTLLRVPTSGGPAEQMGLSMQGTIKSPQITADGRRLYFGSNEAAPEEIWTLENSLSTQRAGK
jgi:Tol biopolymer transport system component